MPDAEELPAEAGRGRQRRAVDVDPAVGKHEGSRRIGKEPAVGADQVGGKDLPGPGSGAVERPDVRQGVVPELKHPDLDRLSLVDVLSEEDHGLPLGGDVEPIGRAWEGVESRTCGVVRVDPGRDLAGDVPREHEHGRDGDDGA